LPLTPFPRPRTERELSALGMPFFLMFDDNNSLKDLYIGENRKRVRKFLNGKHWI